MASQKLAIPLLGVLLWVLSIHAAYLNQITGKELNRSVNFAHSVVNRMLRLETNLGWSNVHVKRGTPSHGQFIVSKPEREALEQGREALIATKATIHLMNAFCHKHNLAPSDCIKQIKTYSFSKTPLKSSCEKRQKICTFEQISSKYRTIDGTCNHKYSTIQGASFTPYHRLLSAVYLDGVQEPRRSVSRKQLPSARFVSANLKYVAEDDYFDLTLAVPEWSRFVEHDLSHTATSKMIHSDNTIECCASSGSNLSPRYIHPFCAPISVPLDDEYYSKHDLDCMTYVRSVPAFTKDCTFGPIEQLNQATHFLDGSHIYGSSLYRSQALRSHHGGALKISQKSHRIYLPQSPTPEDDCQNVDATSTCFTAGDSRANLIPTLTAMHTVWLREHNRIAHALAAINPTWDDDVVFEETRRIVVAELQHITYTEWLPQIFGKNKKLQEKLMKYDEKVDPSVSNAFATAAVRVLNSLMDGKLKLYKENRLVNSSLSLSHHFNNPTVIQENGYLDGLLRGMATQSSRKLDLKFVDDISSQLFSNGIYGYDIFSLDIQRGRDHGLPPYTHFRRQCGLSNITTFHDLRDVMTPDTIKSLADVYTDPHDIDLIVGGVAEVPQSGTLLGPTLTCIFAEQFSRTRRGDRYFYTEALSKAQLREVEKVSLAKVLCDNGDDLEMMQRNVFRKISESNPLEKCETIPGVDLNVWRTVSMVA